MLGGTAFSGGIRLMKEGRHVGNLNIAAAKNADEFDLSVNSRDGSIVVSASVTINSLQLLAYVEQLTAAVESKTSDDIDTDGAA